MSSNDHAERQLSDQRSYRLKKCQEERRNVRPGRLEIGREVIKDSAKIDNTFISHTVPDVHPNTRIIGVCGILDVPIDNIASFMPGLEQSTGTSQKSSVDNTASPILDGWFFSDFFLFNLLLKGLGSYQAWYTGESPRHLLKSYGKKYAPGYVHGNPWQNKKVVLSEEIITGEQLTACTVIDGEKLLDVVCADIKKQCDIARSSGESVLILMFGHGNHDTHGIHIGAESPFEDIKDTLKTIDFQGLTGREVNVTLLTTSCYSGGWSINPNINASVMATAAPDHLSESWPESVSVGRLSGSIFASAVIKTLAAPESPLLEEKVKSQKLKTQEQERTYLEFTKEIHQSLFSGNNMHIPTVYIFQLKMTIGSKHGHFVLASPWLILPNAMQSSKTTLPKELKTEH